MGGAGNGANGEGGAGVAGQDITIVNNGTIRGGLNGDGVTSRPLQSVSLAATTP